MAYSQDSTTSSGYSSNRTSVNTTSLNSHYLCYWLPSCDGQHELDECTYWKSELNGKLGIYYSPSGSYKLFMKDELSTKNLEHNNTGCATVRLLAFNYENQQVLFGLRRCKGPRDDRQKRLLLAFPSAQPCRRNERMLRIPSRAFQWLTTDTEFANQCLKQGLKNRFLFYNANVIYPVYLTNEQASKLTDEFEENEEFVSIHWLPLTDILPQLPPWRNDMIKKATGSELAQIPDIKPTRIRIQNYQLWHVTAMCLMCIREHVPDGFETFLKV